MPQNKANTAGGAFLGSILEELARQDADRQKQMMFDLQVDREKRLTKGQDLNNQLAQERLDSEKEMRAANQAAQATTRAGKVRSDLKMGADLDDAQAGILKAGGYGSEINEQLASTQRQGDPMVGMTAKSSPGFRQFAGTPEQQTRKQLRESPDLTTQQAQYLDAVEASGDKNIDAKMFVTPEAKPATLGSFEDYVMRKFGKAPTAEQVVQARKEYGQADDSAQAGGDKTYFTPVTTGNGVIPFNNITGQWDDSNRRDLKPGETAQKAMTDAESTLFRVGRISGRFNDKWVGPVMGRYNTMQLALLGEPDGAQGLATMAAELAGLQNTVINLRTGAAMSEPEAQRIMKEIPSLNLPPDTFMARLNSAKALTEDWLQKRASMAYGRRTVDTGPNPARPNDPVPAENPQQRAARLIAEARAKLSQRK